MSPIVYTYDYGSKLIIGSDFKKYIFCLKVFAEDVKLYTEVQSTMMNMMMSGMESVLGKVGRHRIVGKLSNFEKHYIR